MDRSDSRLIALDICMIAENMYNQVRAYKPIKANGVHQAELWSSLRYSFVGMIDNRSLLKMDRSMPSIPPCLSLGEGDFPRLIEVCGLAMPGNGFSHSAFLHVIEVIQYARTLRGMFLQDRSGMANV
ncbi:hypothetical protein CspHIS471_0309230 [Cutaneotrichosporon sp. HIS471]|nr:hypothetical protein CspHIS471_0309230 [Cutaneotrichosporon sp. HIS471]